ncbi:MAG TPA: type-F conjugative transfer system pilin assembly protein TrbC [Buttiauxella sp.]|jgi:conjugal transfer pilus assembly protein TrbC
MKTALLILLTVCGLMSGALEASEQPTISPQDRDWMKQQQASLQELQDAMRGQSVQLPAAQQDRVNTLQQTIAQQQAPQGRGDKPAFPAIYFVSLGMPKEGLLPMLQAAHRFGIPATLRGLIHNDMRQTASMMFELSKEDKNIGVQIDPTLYSDYGINVVPALVVTCPGHADVIRGSLPLKQALEKVAEQGDCALTAKKLLAGKP